MKHLTLTSFLFALILLAGNCRKSEISFESNNPPNTGDFSISGSVLDKNNVPVAQAEVKAGSVTARTDVDGYFILNHAKVGFVTVEKSGYFQGSRTFIAHNGAINYVSIRLIKKENTGSFSSASGGTVNLPSGGSISFQANGVVDAQNNPYNGSVSVSTFFIDPSDEGFITLMPGDLRGITTTGEERGLTSYGMMAVELSTSGGQKLQLASGKPATMNFPIPASLVSKAPATIPLWYFDETKGMWKEEGSATKQGDKYVGTVNHFSFWNCDDPYVLVQFETVVKDQNGYAVPDALVVIKKLDDGSIGTGKTDDAGRASGMIPKNAALEMKVTDRCQNVLYTKNIGPYSNNVNYGTVSVTILPPASVTISGTAVDCNNAPITNGFAYIKLDGLVHKLPLTNGSFSITLSRCNANPSQAEIFVEDVAGAQQSPTKSVSVTSGAVNAGQLTGCGVATDQFFNYTLDGINYGYSSPNDSLGFFHSDSLGNSMNGIDVHATSGGSTVNSVSMNYVGSGTGTFPCQLNFRYNDVYYVTKSVTVTVTQYGNVGQFVVASFSGQVTQLPNQIDKNISGTFKLRRRQ